MNSKIFKDEVQHNKENVINEIFLTKINYIPLHLKNQVHP